MDSDSPADDDSPLDDGNETPRVRPLRNADMDALTGCIESLNLTSTVDEVRNLEQRIATPSQSREANGRSSSRPRLQITIPKDIVGWRNSVDSETAHHGDEEDRKRSCTFYVRSTPIDS